MCAFINESIERLSGRIQPQPQHRPRCPLRRQVGDCGALRSMARLAQRLLSHVLQCVRCGQPLDADPTLAQAHVTSESSALPPTRTGAASGSAAGGAREQCQRLSKSGNSSNACPHFCSGRERVSQQPSVDQCAEREAKTVMQDALLRPAAE